MVSDIRRKRIREQRNRETAILLAVFLVFDAAVVAAAVSAKSAAETQQKTAVRCETAAYPQTEASGENPEAETVGMTASEAEPVGGAKIEKTETINSKTEAEIEKTEKETVTDAGDNGADEGTDIDKAAGEEGNETSEPSTEKVEPPEYTYPHSVCGIPFEYADYLHYCLALFGRQDYYPYALAQIYQESAFDPSAVGPDGHDIGLCQFRDTYWTEYASEAGYPGADIWNPYKQIEVYAYHVDKRIRASADLYTTISDHYTGGKGYAPEYVSAVLQWVKYEE